MKATLWLLLLSVSAFAYAPTQAGSEPLEPALEARVQALGKKLRCTACQGLSIIDSPASMARAQVDKVRELVKAGKSDQEVLDYFVERYDEWALLEPSTKGANWMLWLGPAIFVAAGLALLGSVLKRRAKPAPTGAGSVSGATGSAPGSDAYLERVRSEVDS